MSRQTQRTSDEDTEWPDDESDDSEPAPKRKAELRAAYKANLAAGKAPYEDVEIATLGELLWIQNERGWRMDVLDFDSNPANLRGARCAGTNLAGACLYQSDLRGALLLDAILSNAHLEFANLNDADLDQANLQGAIMTGANLRTAGLAGANLKGANLNRAILDVETELAGVLLDANTQLGDVHWNGAGLTDVQWDQVKSLGEESAARNPVDFQGKSKSLHTRLRDFERAVMACRRLATELRNQGLNEHADRFAYRAHMLQRQVLIRQRKVGRWLWSWFLEALAGYGYEPIRTAFIYLGVVFAFAALYINLSTASHFHLTYLAALVMSVASFHGRGFFPAPALPLDSPLAVAGAIEAIFGLVIEASFIATFTQRFFAR